MVILFISIMYTAIVCTASLGAVQCQTMSSSVLSGMVAAGVLELVFEIRGLIKIYRNRTPDEQEKDE